jgi:hypothetical protein
MDEQLLTHLERTLHREMPICEAMEIAVASWDQSFHDGGRLVMDMPLAPNRSLELPLVDDAVVEQQVSDSSGHGILLLKALPAGCGAGDVHGRGLGG